MLSSHFVSLRKEVQRVEQDNDERSSIPITIRFVSKYLSVAGVLTSTLVNLKLSSESQKHSPNSRFPL